VLRVFELKWFENRVSIFTKKFYFAKNLNNGKLFCMFRQIAKTSKALFCMVLNNIYEHFAKFREHETFCHFLKSHSLERVGGEGGRGGEGEGGGGGDGGGRRRKGRGKGRIKDLLSGLNFGLACTSSLHTHIAFFSSSARITAQAKQIVPPRSPHHILFFSTEHEIIFCITHFIVSYALLMQNIEFPCICILINYIL
jgi:hypothetical protein